MTNDKVQMIAQALVPAAPPPGPVDPLLPNPALEQAAAPNNIPMNPVVQAIANHLGLLNLIRNRSNTQVVDPLANL